MLPKLKPRNCTVAFLASAFQAFGIYHVHAVADVTEGGILGATLLLHHWLDISPAISSFLLNAVCFLLGLKILGPAFIGYSFWAAAGYSIGYRICEIFPPLWPQIAGYPLAAALLGSAFIGIGAGLTVRSGGATTGDDALAMSLSHKTGIPIQRFYLISDTAVLLLSLSYIPLSKILYSLLTVVLSGQIIGLMQPKRKDVQS